PEHGAITLAGQDIAAMSAKQLARHLAVVSQESAALFEFSVQDIVLMGRAPHKRLLEADSAADVARAQDALRQVGLAAHGQRSITTLSGGEKQRVMLARALVQDAPILVLDEPTNHLDIHYQLQLMELIRTLRVSVITALHDLNLAARYCDRIYVLQDGSIAAAGTPEEVLTQATLRRVFRVDADILRHPRTGKLHIVYVAGAPGTASLPSRLAHAASG